jgi:hypothetical protein
MLSLGKCACEQLVPQWLLTSLPLQQLLHKPVQPFIHKAFSDFSQCSASVFPMRNPLKKFFAQNKKSARSEAENGFFRGGRGFAMLEDSKFNASLFKILCTTVKQWKCSAAQSWIS